MRNRFAFLIFLGVFLAILGIADVVVFEAIAFTFSVQNSVALITLGSVLAFFTLGFIGATVLGMRIYNIFTRTFYTLCATWMGTFAYLFFASVLIGVSAFFSKLIPLTALAHIGIVLFAMAIGISVYGIVHGQKIVIKNITVPLPHLPDTWHNKTLLWISDLHLGQVYGKQLVESIVTKIFELKPDVVCIGGDLFDGTKTPPLSDFLEPFRGLHIPLGMYFVSGNHEEFGSEKIFFEAIQRAGIQILSDEIILLDGLQLIGVDYRNSSQQENFQKVLAGLNVTREIPSILLKHEPKDLDLAERAGISLQISGHTHNGQQFPFGFIASRIYKSFGYGLKMFGRMQVFVSSGAGTWGPPLRVGSDSEIVVFSFSSSEKE